ncbi:hypothetical protein ACFOW1_14955 [Parasediminibacterium paludis]|uniref:Uncharacterized protein n=1 Tax=Parasediminibacterium paludis TaxID=908966 RepID=A0ABV8Q192_9BACT
MNMQTFNNIAKRIIVLNMVVITLCCAVQAKATTINATKFPNTVLDSASAPKLDLKYVGNTTDGLEFDVRYNNISGKYFYFVIKDGNGVVLFEQSYKNKVFYKKVQLPEVGDIKALSFTILNDKDEIVQTKEVKITTNFVEDVFVKIN